MPITNQVYTLTDPSSFYRGRRVRVREVTDFGNCLVATVELETGLPVTMAARAEFLR